MGSRSTRPTACIVSHMEAAHERQIVRLGPALVALAAQHGISGLQRAGDGQLVGDVAPGRTLLDIALFELAAQSLLHARICVISSRSALATDVATGPLVIDSASAA